MLEIKNEEKILELSSTPAWMAHNDYQRLKQRVYECCMWQRLSQRPFGSFRHAASQNNIM